MSDRGPYIQTFSGRPFYLLDPRAEEIEIRDIAHALSHLCRFTGHSRKLYTVAQHCLVVSDLVPPELALEGLLHDATEAYVGDVSSPLKGVLGAAYTDIEDAIHVAIAERFKLASPFPSAIKHADYTAFATEVRDFMFATEVRDFMLPLDDWLRGKLPDPVDTEMDAMSPTVVRAEYLDRFKELER